MSWKVYRPGEGRWARLVALVAFLAVGGFSAFRWYLWVEEKDWRRALLPVIGVYQITWSQVGAAVLMVFMALVGYRVCFARPKTSDFLVETEIELRKVTWPAWKPLFRWSTELWGNTYIVIFVIAALALFLFVVDLALLTASGAIFLRAR